MIRIDRIFIIHFVKYSFVGFINFVFGFFVYFIVLKIFKWNYLFAFTISWLFGVMLTYIINFLWVFKPEDKLNFKKSLIKYVVVYVLSYLLNLILLKIIVESTDGNPIFIQLYILPFIVSFNFSGIKFWAMKKQF